LSVLGLGDLLEISSSLFYIIKFCDAVFRIYLGVKTLRAAKIKLDEIIAEAQISRVNWLKI
jgi:threonine/homoserine/homoserine lactone efflux protein